MTQRFANRKRSQTVRNIVISRNRKRNVYMPIEFENIPLIFFLYVRTLNMCLGAKTKPHGFPFKTTGNLSTPWVIGIIYKHPALAEVFQYFCLCLYNPFDTFKT